MSFDLVTLGEALVQLNAQQTGPLRHVHSFEKHAAGSEFNVAVAAARLGLKTAWLGKVGRDEFGRFVLACARAEGVDTSAVAYDGDAPTGLFLVQRGYPLGRSSSIYYRRGSAGSKMSPSDVRAEHVSNARIFHFSGISLAVSSALKEACWAAVDAARAGGVKISFDVNFRHKLWDEEAAAAEVTRVLKIADVVFCGLHDAQLLFDARSAQQGVEILRSLGPEHAVVTMGPEGALMSVGDAEFSSSPRQVPVVDSTGAGDAFAAAVLVGLANGWAPEKSLALASIVGASVCTVVGDYEGVPYLSELEDIAGGTWVAR
ncbi:MAG: sugar kinase [Actinomycetota bacterium]